MEVRQQVWTKIIIVALFVVAKKENKVDIDEYQT